MADLLFKRLYHSSYCLANSCAFHLLFLPVANHLHEVDAQIDNWYVAVCCFFFFFSFLNIRNICGGKIYIIYFCL